MSEAEFSGLAEPQPLSSLRRAGQVFLLLVVAAGIAAAWRWRRDLDPATLASLIRGRPAAPIVFLALHIVASLTFLPRTLLGVAAGIVFGMWRGLVWASIGGAIGAIAGFLLARYLRGRMFERARWARLTAALERAGHGGWRTIALIRLVPVIPHSLTNYALGLTSVGLGEYTLGSLLGQMPTTVAAVELGAAGQQAMLGAGDWLWPTVIGLTALVASLLIPLIVRRWRARPE